VKLTARSLAALAYDVAAALVTWWLAYLLRFNFSIPAEEWGTLRVAILVATPAYGAIFLAFGLYSAIWRYASMHDLRRIVFAVGLGAVIVPTVFIMLRVADDAPRAVLVMQPLLLLFLVGASRIALRAWREGGLFRLSSKERTPIVVLGAGAAAASLIREMNRQSTWQVAALLDDDPQKQGREISGYRVVGPLQNVGPVAGALGVRHAVIAMPGATHQQRLRALDLCKAAGLDVRTVPSYFDLVSGRVSVSDIREVQLDDLLGRDPVQLDEAGLQGFFGGKTVLVTGAGGSIGAELCRQIARFSPARLVLFEQSEFSLYSIEQEFRDRRLPVEVVAAIGDAKNEARVGEVFARHRPEIVFHAAAYKHVPLMEEGNAFEAVRNNVGSTLVVARAARANGAGKFVLVSTDKAVNPANVMGASKRLAEIACQALQMQADGATQFVIVRFGNVLGSTGSVVPRFREQIARGGPVTVTHRDIQRYFMSIPEAAQLVLQAGQMGRGSEIYVLDMGEPVRIVDLARQMIRLSGFAESDIRIEFTGLRPGEKLYEEPLADAETTLATPHPKLRIARVRTPQDGDFLGELDAWLAKPADSGASGVRARLQDWIPEYRPSTTSP